MKIKTSLLCASLLVGVSSAALADWSGFYIGPQVSYTWMNTDLQFPESNTVAVSPDGFTVGPHLGYAYQMDEWVFALEGSYTGGSYSAKESDNTIKVDQVYTVTPLLGYTVEDWMFYAKGGFISGNVHVDGANFSEGERQSGVTAGAGFAYQFDESNALGLEYNYSRLAKTSFDDVDVGAININTVSLVYSRYFW